MINFIIINTSIPLYALLPARHCSSLLLICSLLLFIVPYLDAQLALALPLNTSTAPCCGALARGTFMLPCLVPECLFLRTKKKRLAKEENLSFAISVIHHVILPVESWIALVKEDGEDKGRKGKKIEVEKGSKQNE